MRGGRALICALGLGIAAPARADVPANLYGGRIVSSRQAWFGAGFPHFEGGVRVPFGDFELGARLRFTYGVAYATIPTTAALVPGVDLRWQLLESGELDGALLASIDLGVGFPQSPVAVGIGLLSPGWLFTYRVEQLVDVDFGLRFYDDLWIQGEDVFFLLALPIVLGLEWAPSPTVNLAFRFEAGPSFGVAAQGAIPIAGAPTLPVGGVGARVTATVGASFNF